MPATVCLRCLKPLNPERKQAGFDRCIACQPQWRYKGALNFGHKTGGSIQPLHPTVYANFKKVSTRKAKGTHGASFQSGTTQAFVVDR